MPQLNRKLIRVVNVREFFQRLNRLVHVETFSRQIQIIRRMIRRRHDNMNRRRLPVQMIQQRIKQIFVLRAPSRLFRRVEVGIAVKIIKALRERHFCD